MHRNLPPGHRGGTPNGRRVSRREFLARTAQAGVVAAVGPTLWLRRATAETRTLRILQWSHFVPSYDAWFDQFAHDWGTRRGVEVVVDHIALADLGTRANAEVAAQQGHDLFQFVSPPAAFAPHVLDTADVVQEAVKRHGPILDLARQSTYNPVTKRWLGVCDNWVPDPGNYLKKPWSDIGMPDGPDVWEDLVRAGPLLRQKHPEILIPIGMGMSQELDSNMAARAILWSFDGAVQDENENVVLRSDATREAIDFVVRLFKASMNPAVMSWNAASNNQALNASQTSYIQNSISAYRTAQANHLPVADDILFVDALKGPRGTRWASTHVIGIYVIWKFAKAADLAQQFLLDLLDHYRDAVTASKLYNFPAFPGSVADPGTALDQKPKAGEAWLQAVTSNDPFGSKPSSKLNALGSALQWTTNIGHPGPANPAIGEVFDTFVLPTMFASAASGRVSPKQALEEAASRTEEIFEKWRKRGVVSGGTSEG